MRHDKIMHGVVTPVEVDDPFFLKHIMVKARSRQRSEHREDCPARPDGNAKLPQLMKVQKTVRIKSENKMRFDFNARLLDDVRIADVILGHCKFAALLFFQ